MNITPKSQILKKYGLTRLVGNEVFQIVANLTFFKGAKALVAARICNFCCADAEHFCDAAKKTLTHLTNSSDKTVKRTIEEMESAGLAYCLERFDGKNQLTNRLYLTPRFIEALCQIIAFAKEHNPLSPKTFDYANEVINSLVNNCAEAVQGGVPPCPPGGDILSENDGKEGGQIGTQILKPDLTDQIKTKNKKRPLPKWIPIEFIRACQEHTQNFIRRKQDPDWKARQQREAEERQRLHQRIVAAKAKKSADLPPIGTFPPGRGNVFTVDEMMRAIGA